MKIVFRPHAVDRMKERNLTSDDIEKVLSEPDGMIKQSRDKRIYYKILPRRKDDSVAVVAVGGREIGFEVITVLVNFEVNHER